MRKKFNRAISPKVNRREKSIKFSQGKFTEQNLNRMMNIYLRRMLGIYGAYTPGISDNGGHVTPDFLAYLVLQGSEHSAISALGPR